MSSSIHNYNNGGSSSSKPTTPYNYIAKSYSSANYASRTLPVTYVTDATSTAPKSQVAASRQHQNPVTRIAADLIALQSQATASSHSVTSRPASVKPKAAHKGSCSQQQQKSDDCGPTQTYVSEVESMIMRAVVPIEVGETEEITVNGQTGIWANKGEVVGWRGCIPITEYKINVDSYPEVITKRAQQNLEYVQELAIRYLRPPTPPPPGEILITQECNTLTPPAPPIIIRQQPARPATPEPLVIREAPPRAPCQVGKRVITISGKRLPPPPRKVVIERLAPIPVKPQSVIIERWLPYAEVKRRVIINRPCCPDPVVCRPKNTIVQWEAPQVVIKKDFKYLGVINANPVEYVKRYGATLTLAQNLPDFVHDIKTPDGLVLAADYKPNPVHELEGDIDALNLIDLEKEGLAEYQDYLKKQPQSSTQKTPSGSRSVSCFESAAPSNSQDYDYSSQSIQFSPESQNPVASAEESGAPEPSELSDELSNNKIIELIFKSIDRQNLGRIRQEDAEKILLRLNSRLGRRYGEDDVDALFDSLDENHDRLIDLEEFRKAFLNLSLN